MTADQPLRLATGSHRAGSGKGCAMNVISWENGDSRITDMPACTDPMLARIVQRINDTICSHRDGDLLCPDCSIKVLALAHRTVGTGLPADVTDTERLNRRRVWVRVAADQARQVLHLAHGRAIALAAIEAAEAWADDPSEANRRAAYATDAAAADADDAAAATDAAYAAYAAADADAAYAAYAAADAAGAYAATNRLELAHRAIDVFQQHTGHTDRQPDPASVTRAYSQMTEVAR